MSIEKSTAAVAFDSSADSAPAGWRNYRWLTSLGTLLALLTAIELCIRGFDVPSYIFPAPSEVIRSLYTGFAAPLTSKSSYYPHILTTVSEALGWIIP